MGAFILDIVDIVCYIVCITKGAYMKRLLLLLLLPACANKKMTPDEITQALSMDQKIYTETDSASQIKFSDDDITCNVFQLPPDNDDLIWFKMMKLQDMISDLNKMIAIQEMRIRQLEALAQDFLEKEMEDKLH